jgi:hypothetical protein
MCGCGESIRWKSWHKYTEPKYISGHNGKGYNNGMYRPIDERLWEKVHKTDSCWIWTGYKDGKGYGRIGYNGKVEKPHRVSWMIANGEIPEGMFVCHHCDNPSCVNPEHLFLGTNNDNQRDMYNKGRGNKSHGEQHYRAKLTIEVADLIRKMYSTGCFSQRTLAKIFSVARAQIGAVINNKRWIKEEQKEENDVG